MTKCQLPGYILRKGIGSTSSPPASCGLESVVMELRQFQAHRWTLYSRRWKNSNESNGLQTAQPGADSQCRCFWTSSIMWNELTLLPFMSHNILGSFCYSSLSHTPAKKKQREKRGNAGKGEGSGRIEKIREDVWEKRQENKSSLGDEGGIFPNNQTWWLWKKVAWISQGYKQEKKRPVSELAQGLVSGRAAPTSPMEEKLMMA